MTVYFATQSLKNAPCYVVKIGCTGQTIPERLKTLKYDKRYSKPNVAWRVLGFCAVSGWEDEEKIHELFKSFQIEGEMFRLTERQIKEVLCRSRYEYQKYIG